MANQSPAQDVKLMSKLNHMQINDRLTQTSELRLATESQQYGRKTPAHLSNAFITIVSLYTVWGERVRLPLFHSCSRLDDAGSRPRARSLSRALNLAECWTAMTSDINYNQEEESAARNLQIRNIHTWCNLIIKGTLCGGMIVLWCEQWEADPNFWERVFMESKGLCLDRAQAGGLGFWGWWEGRRGRRGGGRPASAQPRTGEFLHD